jgi:hypothetical protein
MFVSLYACMLVCVYVRMYVPKNKICDAQSGQNKKACN